jgi:hypothetical protein
VATYLFWRSAYLSTLFSLRNRTMVATDWIKVKLFGRCVFPVPNAVWPPALIVTFSFAFAICRDVSRE